MSSRSPTYTQHINHCTDRPTVNHRLYTNSTIMPKPVVNESTSTEAKGGGPSASKKALSKSTKSSKQPPKKATSTKAKAKAKANNKSASAKRKKPGRNTLMTKAVVDEKIHRGRNQRLGATRVHHLKKTLLSKRNNHNQH